MFGRQPLIYCAEWHTDCRACGTILEHPMFNMPMVADNRHMVLWQPLDALKIKKHLMFTPIELIDVQAAADFLTHDRMPIMRMMQPVAWLALCVTLAEWMVEFKET